MNRTMLPIEQPIAMSLRTGWSPTI